ncbi:MAG: hypothetical protein AAB795_00975 [Patescibacteria group bacterium]
MTINVLSHHANAAVMIIDESHQNALQGLLKEQTLSFGNFDLFAFLDVKNFNIEDKNTNTNKERSRKALLIDMYFNERNMPLEGYGKKFIEEAEKYNLDWRLLPALAIRESSGGKFACNNNPFGWASCKVNFDSVDEAIEMVAWNLAGANPRTKQYYEGDINDKLHYYNGSIIKGYEAQVIRIMIKIAGD